MITKQLPFILILTFLTSFSCSNINRSQRKPASIDQQKSYQEILLFPDSESLTQKIFPTYAKLHYDIISQTGTYIGKIELKRANKFILSILSPKVLPFLANQVNQWTSRSFDFRELDYLQRTKFYTGLQLGAQHNITLKVRKDNTLEMVIKGESTQHHYLLDRVKAYPLD